MKKSAPTLAMTPVQQAIYQRLLDAVHTIGPFTADPKKTSIHLTRRSAFAGIAARKDALQLTIKSAIDISSPRIVKREQASANRWHLEIRLEDPDQVDRELTSWLAAAMRLSN